MVLRKGTFQSSTPPVDTDLMQGTDGVTALARGLGSNVYTIPSLPTAADYYSIYMEAYDANKNPVQGTSQVFIIGSSDAAKPNSVVLISPVQGSVYFTETYDNPYLIRWQYVGLTFVPDSFSIDLLDAANNVAAQIYIKSRYVFNDTFLTGVATPSANWIIPAGLAGPQQYKVKFSAFPINNTLAGVSATSGLFSISLPPASGGYPTLY